MHTYTYACVSLSEHRETVVNKHPCHTGNVVNFQPLMKNKSGDAKTLSCLETGESYQQKGHPAMENLPQHILSHTNMEKYTFKLQ